MKFVILSIFVLTPFIVITLFRKYSFAKKIGTVIMAYAVGILLSLLFSFTQIFPERDAESFTNIRDLIRNISVLLAIPLMLFSSNFKMWTKSLPQAVTALFTGISAICTAVIGTFFIFKCAGLETMPNVAAMMTGLYTGGTMNFSALGRALDVEGNIITLTLTSEMVIILPFLLFLTAGGYKVFRWLLPFNDETHVARNNDVQKTLLIDVENYDGMLNKRIFPKTLLGLLLSASFFAIGAGISKLITGELHDLVIILTITTLAIAASFSKKIRILPRTFELGMFFILIFSVIVANEFDVTKLNSEAFHIFFYVLSITVIAIFVHLVLCRLFKVSGDLVTVAIVALFCSPPFVPPVVSAMKNRKVLISGITIGLVGYAIGTYLGVGIFYLLGLF